MSKVSEWELVSDEDRKSQTITNSSERGEPPNYHEREVQQARHFNSCAPEDA